MDAQTRMDRSIDAVVHDIELSRERVAGLRTELAAMEGTKGDHARIQRMTELVSDLHARLEGIEVFVQSCQRRAHAHEQPSEEIDLWM